LPKLILFLLTIVFLAVGARSVGAVASGVIQNDSSYVDTFGHYHVVGEVRNIGDVWFQSILISVTLKDQTGAIVDIRQASPWLQHLPPQAAIGFDVAELGAGKSAMIRSYALALAFQSGPSRSASLEISGLVTSRNSVGWLQVQGMVMNAGVSGSDNTNVTGTFYGSDGKVVFVTFTTPTISTIQPGTSQPFTLTIVDSARSRLVTRFSVAAESNEYTSVLTYTSIPEFPWQSAIITWFALAAVLIVMRKRRRTKNLGLVSAISISIEQVNSLSLV
jgi:hypothetical protein